MTLQVANAVLLFPCKSVFPLSKSLLIYIEKVSNNFLQINQLDSRLTTHLIYSDCIEGTLILSQRKLEWHVRADFSLQRLRLHQIRPSSHRFHGIGCMADIQAVAQLIPLISSCTEIYDFYTRMSTNPSFLRYKTGISCKFGVKALVSIWCVIISQLQFLENFSLATILIPIAYVVQAKGMYSLVRVILFKGKGEVVEGRGWWGPGRSCLRKVILPPKAFKQNFVTKTSNYLHWQSTQKKIYELWL